MKLVKKDYINNYLVTKDLSINAQYMLNSLLTRSDTDLENINLYSLMDETRKNIALAFRELRKKKYVTYSTLDDTYYVYAIPQKNN